MEAGARGVAAVTLLAMVAVATLPGGLGASARTSPTVTTFDGLDLPHGYFGWSVAIDNDLVAIGTGYAKVHLFEAKRGGWTEKVLPKPTTVHSTYGHHTEVSGDIVVVGAPGTSRSSDKGSVVVYEKTGTTWHTTILRPQSSESYTFFGRSFGFDGERLVVGAARDCKCVWLFERTALGVWVQSEIRSTSGGSWPAYSVDLDGDLVAVGHPDENRVHAFREQPDGAWQEQVFTEHATVGCCIDDLGGSLSVSGGRIAAVAWGPTWAGSTLYVYEQRDDGSWWKRSHQDLSRSPSYGNAHMDGDLVVVGYGESAALFRITDTGIVRVRSLAVPEDNVSGGGRHVAVDDGNVVVAGSVFDRHNVNAGRVYLYGGDRDQDQLTDLDELVFGTDPDNPDTDGDGLVDGRELDNIGTDPLDADSDDDGLLDGAEVDTHGTDPLVRDTDADLYGDGTEIRCGSDPRDRTNVPSPLCGLPDEFPILGHIG